MNPILHDDQGRDRVATLPGNGFAWELWVNIETEDALIRKRFTNLLELVCRFRVSSDADYDEVLQDYVDKIGRTHHAA